MHGGDTVILRGGGSGGGIPGEVAAVVLRATQALILVLDRDGRIVLFNPACEEATGYLAAEVLGEKLWRFLHRDDAGAAREVFEDLRRVPIPAEHECRWRTKSGSQRVIAWSYRAMVSDSGTLTHVVATGVDLTDQRATEHALAEREAELALIMSSLPIGYYAATWDEPPGQFTVTRANALCAEIVGAMPSDENPFTLTQFVHPDDLPDVEEAISQVVGAHEPAERVVRILRPDGELRWVRSRGAPVLDHEHRLVGGVGWLMDITPEVQAVEEADHLVEVLDAATDLVVLLAPGGEVTYANPATLEVLGSEPARVEDLLDEPSRETYEREVLPALERLGHWRGEMTIVRGDGAKMPVSQLFLAHGGPDGPADRTSMIARDISESKQLEQRLSHLAFHDPLTGLPNRTLVLDRLTQALDRASRSQGHVAVMFLDLDYFKSVNDELGHKAGDELLRITAERLTAAVRPGDTVSRLGGDEFVVICEEIHDPRESLRIAERIRTTMDRPFTIGDAAVRSSASIGIALAKDTGVDPAELLTQADIAAYQAKERGRNRYEQYRG